MLPSASLAKPSRERVNPPITFAMSVSLLKPSRSAYHSLSICRGPPIREELLALFERQVTELNPQDAGQLALVLAQPAQEPVVERCRRHDVRVFQVIAVVVLAPTADLKAVLAVQVLRDVVGHPH